MRLTLTTLAVAIAGAFGCGAPAAVRDSDLPPLKYPPIRINRAEEALLMARMNDLRSMDYLSRVKAEADLGAMLAEDAIDIAPYLVQMMNEPQLDIRISVVRLFIKHGVGSPEAASILVRVLADPGMPPSLRDDVASSLRRWTGLDFGYRVWTDPGNVAAAAEMWRNWLEETGGIIRAD